ncbi:hypothetical protein [Lederbergia citrea]|uniref:Uncharacterized protein n=1 Tax=Lederbergia citrea TaxID=2833581 RepID=A0A942Z555_9BACI|nr:hypothetical protein [Lederbergia citrea]MBS4223062.1 hypothetical protein [Lederbergia citrea]
MDIWYLFPKSFEKKDIENIVALPRWRLVDFRYSCSLSAGRAVSLLGVNACGVSPVPLTPQESRTFAPINLQQILF